jgi:1-acyl-sn-glycerol-3-phosphate acyltransferase
MPDLNRGRYIFAPNHVSDVDAPVLGLLHRKMRIVSKNDWTNNEKLKGFLGMHYDLRGLDRASLQSLRDLLTSSVAYFNDNGDDNRHFLVFSQGTISDFNNNSPERISTIAQKISEKTNVPIVIVFAEQVSLSHPTRIVFDEPMLLTKKDDFRQIWLEREKYLQNSLTPPARRPNLTAKHQNNNKPGDLYF